MNSVLTRITIHTSTPTYTLLAARKYIFHDLQCMYSNIMALPRRPNGSLAEPQKTMRNVDHVQHPDTILSDQIQIVHLFELDTVLLFMTLVLLYLPFGSSRYRISRK